jgi:hypothetical protein
MAYIRRMKIRVDSSDNIMNQAGKDIMESYETLEKILDWGNTADPDDANNILTWVKFPDEATCEEYYNALSEVMTAGVDDGNFTILETTNETVAD